MEVLWSWSVKIDADMNQSMEQHSSAAVMLRWKQELAGTKPKEWTRQ